MPDKQPDDVLTLAEAASYLRVPEEELLRLAEQRDVPAQRIGGEWRFLKGALGHWLTFGPRFFLDELLLAIEKRLLERIGPEKQQRGSKAAVRKHVGVLKEEGDVEEVLAGLSSMRAAKPAGAGDDHPRLRHFHLLTYEQAKVVRHYEAAAEGEQLAVTAVTRIEVLRGRTDSLLKAADEHESLAAAKRLQATEAALNDFLVVHVEAEAAKHFKAFLGQKKLKMRRPDLLIACIALAQDALLVSRNTKDFSKVPGLKLANWADD